MGRFVSLDTTNHLPSKKPTDNLNETEKKSGQFVKVGDTSKIGANSNARFRVESDVSGDAWTRATPSQAKLKTVYTSSQEREISKLQEQRRQAQVDMDIDTMNALDARMKAIRASAGQQTIADRVSDVLSTAASRTGNAIASAVGTVSNAYNDPDYNRRQIAQAQKALETGRTSDGKPVTPAMRQTLQDRIDRMNQEIADWESENSVTNRLYTAANTMRDDSRKHEESAKQGLGKAGQFAVDVGVAGAQMAGDVLASAIVPGSGLALMGVRSFGAGAQEARDNGASIGQQMAYGAGSAALSVATEKIANVAAPFKKAFGDGVLEKAIPGVVQKLSGSAAGKAALSMLSEGGEEMVEDLLQPILQRATYDPEALVNYKNSDYWTNMLYDGLVGAALGGVGAGVEQIGNRAAGTTQKPASFDAQARPVQSDGNSMGAAENAAQGVSGGVMEQEAQRLFGQQKAASTVETAVTVESGPSAINERNKTNNTLAYTLATNIDSIKDMQPVSRLSGTEMNNRSVKPDQQIRTFFQSLGNKIFRNGLGEVQLNEYGIASMLNHKPLNRSKMLSIAAVPDVIQNGKQVGYSDNWKGRGYASYIFAAPVKVGNDTVYVAAVVDQRPDNKFYLSEMVDSNGNYVRINESPSGSSKSGVTDGAGVPGGDGITTRPEGLSMGSAPSAPKTGAEPALPYVDSTIAQGAENVNVDPLLKMMMGGKRVDQSRASNEQFAALADRGDIGVDAAGKLYQVDPAQHIDQRTVDGVADRSVNAFQFDHPELHEYYQRAANALIADADLSLQFPMNRSYERTMQGNKVNQSVQASAHLRQAMDETGLSRAEIIDAAQRIVHDQGQENVKAAKQVEIILDSMLTNGWSTMMGDTVGPNQAYIDAKSSIMGSQPTMQSGEELPMMDDGLGNANAGTVNTAFDDMQAKSDTFHPVNPNSAQRIMNDQQRAPSEVPTVNPDTGKNIGKTVSTILNSPLTSPEMATQIESAVADGQFDYIPVTDKGANLRAQQDLSNRGLQTVADSFIAKVELGQRITKNDTASAIAAYNQAVADGNHALAFDLMTAIADAAHDSAQVVQSMNLMNRLTPEGRLLTLRKYVDKLNRQQNSKPGRQTATANATQEQVDAARTNYVEQATGFRISDELAANYLMAETDAERAAAWDAITTDIASQIPSTFREKANFWRYTSMLLNPTTHVRNFMGNAIQAGARTIKNGVGALIERAVVKDASQRTKSVVLGKEGKALRDFAKSQYEADKSAAMGAGKYSDASAAGISREIQDKRKAFQGSNPLSKAAQAVGDFNTRLLDAEDVLFNKSAYVDSFAQALQAKGVTAAEAAGGAKTDLVAQARAYAIEEAQKATYRNTTALSEYLSKKGRYDEAGSIVDKGAAIVVDAFFPFRRTPSNVLTTGIDYSPVGLTKAITYDAYQVKAGNMSAADMVDHLSAGLTGTGILALGAYLAAEGLLKVRTGDDDREKDYNKDRGMQDYSLQIGDKSYTLDWAVPAAMPLFAGAAIMESAGEGGSGFDAVMDAMGGIGQVVLETSMLSSLNDFISNISYADDKFLYAIDRTVTSYAGQYIPTVGSKIASAMDDTVRKSYVEKGTGQLASDLGYFAQSMEKKIPGARETLQPKVDLWGNEVSNGEVGDRLLQSFLSPGYFNTVDTGDLDKELRRLAEATGSSAVYPAEVEKSFKVGGETKNLTAEEYTKYAKAVGQARYQAVSALTGNSGYKKLTDEEKAKAVAYAYEYATVKGKQAVSNYKPSDTSFAKGAMNSVLPIDSYILYKITADKDGNGSVSGTESARTLQGLSGLTDKQRGQEWAKRNSSTNEAKNPFIGALPKAGISVDTSIKIYEKYCSLSNAEGMKPKEKGAQLRSYVNSLGLTAAQMQAVKDAYSLYGSYYVDW